MPVVPVANIGLLKDNPRICASERDVCVKHVNALGVEPVVEVDVRRVEVIIGKSTRIERKTEVDCIMFNWTFVVGSGFRRWQVTLARVRDGPPTFGGEFSVFEMEVH